MTIKLYNMNVNIFGLGWGEKSWHITKEKIWKTYLYILLQSINGLVLSEVYAPLGGPKQKE